MPIVRRTRLNNAACTVWTLLTSRLHTTTASKTRHHHMRC